MVNQAFLEKISLLIFLDLDPKNPNFVTLFYENTVYGMFMIRIKIYHLSFGLPSLVKKFD